MEHVANILTVILSSGPLPGLLILFALALVAFLGWLLMRIMPMLDRIAMLQTATSAAQEMTAQHLAKTGETLASLFEKINEHDKQAALVKQNQDIMHKTCNEHGDMICDAKDFFTGCHKEEMLALTGMDKKLDFILQQQK